MLNLFSLSSYVQFLGAFNFANVYSPVQDKLFEHFLNIDKMFSDSFYGMREKIRSDIDSVKSMGLIETTTGFSNSQAIRELKDSLSSILKEEKELREQTNKRIKKEFTMGYSRPMFMSFGLYCTFELLTFGLMDMLGCQSIYASFALYNVFMIILSLYFVLCEIFRMTHILQSKSLLKPTHWWMMITSIVAYGVFFANSYIVETFGCKFEIPLAFTEWMCYSCMIIPVIPFLVVFLFTYIYYKRSESLINRGIGNLSKKFEEIHDRKKNLDIAYSMFSKDEVSYGNMEFK